MKALPLSLVLMTLMSGAAEAQTSLPYPQAPFKGTIGATAQSSRPDYPQEVKAPQGAPNIVLILLDDVGFGASSTFGGPVATPELDHLASGGLRYNAFNTVAICSPTRAALLTGRNHHQVGFANVVDVNAGYPGYNGVWHRDTASVAEILKDNGYSTAAFGKWHNTPSWEMTSAGPFDHWPTGLGFEYYYGFMYGETSEWEPRLYRGTVAVEQPRTFAQGYHLTNDLVDDAIHWVHQHEAVAADKPFFLYFATGAAHAPHHVPQEWIDKYKGRFDQGWDKLREETFARQKKLGVIPAKAELTPRPDGLPAWASLTLDQKKLYARQMEVYAAYLAHTDHEIGRLLKDIDDDGLTNNTLVMYIVGDNGGSAEGGLEGSDANLATAVGGAQESIEEQLSHYSDLGSPLYDNHFAAGWSWATTAPFQWMKQVASHFGGTRNGFVVSWPGHTKHSEIVRSQFSHVNDIAPTIYEAAHVQFPDAVNGVKQLPLEGKSLVATFTDPKAASRHNEQYFEVFGNRALYKDGWVAAARRYAPWELFTNPAVIYRKPLDQDRWELYHVAEDYSEAHDLADKYPDKLKELQNEFDKEARRNDVYPLVPLPLVGAPSVAPKEKLHYVFLSGVERVPLSAVPSGSRSHTVTADLEVPAGGAQGVIVAEGGRYGGFSLYVKDGKLTYENNTLGLVHERVESSEPLPSGKVQVSAVFTAEPPPQGAHMDLIGAGGPVPGTAQIFIAGKKVGETRFSKFGGFASSITETFDVGRDGGSPVSRNYEAPFAFDGKVDKVTLDLKP